MYWEWVSRQERKIMERGHEGRISSPSLSIGNTKTLNKLKISVPLTPTRVISGTIARHSVTTCFPSIYQLVDVPRIKMYRTKKMQTTKYCNFVSINFLHKANRKDYRYCALPCLIVKFLNWYKRLYSEFQ